MVYKANKKEMIHNARGRFDDVAWGVLQAGLRTGSNMCAIARRLNVDPSTLRYQMKFTVPPSERKAWRAPSVSSAKTRQMKTRRALVENIAKKTTVREQQEKRKPFTRREILREVVRESRQFDAREFRILASQKVIDIFLDEEAQSLAMLEEFIAKPISLQVETIYTQEQYDIVLM